ncbi:MAG: rhomboid family intramembrane serine protease [Proteobacteria bacterium]|nr:rhomboid family intramembrane serine protease [Pseudomonadota bacterium]
MFPLKDDIPSRHFPVVNLVLIIANILSFTYEMSLGPQLESFIVTHGFVPVRFSAELAGNFMPLSSYLPVFTSMFIHGGLLHVFSNLWMLWIFGDNVEDRMGHGRYLLFYLLCGVGAALAQFWANPQAQSPMIGASGAIAGVLGAYFLLYPRARILTFIPIFILFYLVEIPAYFFIGFWFLMQFLQGAAQQVIVGRLAEGGVAWWAHVGGFVAGVVLLYFFKREEKRTDRV